MTLYVVECVWRVGRSTLLSAPLPPSCCLKCIACSSCAAPPPLFSPGTRPPLVPSALWTSALSSLHYFSASFLIIPILPSSIPKPSLPSNPPSSVFTWCLRCRCPINDRSCGSLSPHYPSLHPFDLRSGAWFFGAGMRPILEVHSVKHTYTTCVFCAKETAILWCEDRWLPVLIIF